MRRRRPVASGDAPCTRGRSGPEGSIFGESVRGQGARGTKPGPVSGPSRMPVALKPDVVSDASLPRRKVATRGEEEKSPGRAPEEPAESDAGQRPDPPVPARRARWPGAAGRRSRAPEGRPLAPPHDHRGQSPGNQHRLRRMPTRSGLTARRRRLDLPARSRRPHARPDLDGPLGRRADALLPRPPAAQEPGDRGPQRRHGRRPGLVPAGDIRRGRRADREGRAPRGRRSPAATATASTSSPRTSTRCSSSRHSPSRASSSA